MNLNVYSPLEDLSVCCGEHTELINAINHSLELAPNERTEFDGLICKRISVKQILEDNARLKKYVQEPKILWDFEHVSKAIFKYLLFLKKIYELQGWRVSWRSRGEHDENHLWFGGSLEDYFIFEF